MFSTRNYGHVYVTRATFSSFTFERKPSVRFNSAGTTLLPELRTCAKNFLSFDSRIGSLISLVARQFELNESEERGGNSRVFRGTQLSRVAWIAYAILHFPGNWPLTKRNKRNRGKSARPASLTQLPWNLSWCKYIFILLRVWKKGNGERRGEKSFSLLLLLCRWVIINAFTQLDKKFFEERISSEIIPILSGERMNAEKSSSTRAIFSIC